MPPPLDLTGRTFGRWTVLRRHGLSRDRKVLWLCQCTCGRQGHVTSGNLTQGTSTQCRQCADTFADRGSRAPVRPRTPRVCVNPACRKEFISKSVRAKYCSPECKSHVRWQEVAADPVRRRQHSCRVCAADRDRRHIDHPSCAHCGQPFRAGPSRLHCSRECLDAVIAAGKYRNAFHQRQVVAEAATLSAELQRRMTDE